MAIMVRLIAIQSFKSTDGQSYKPTDVISINRDKARELIAQKKAVFTSDFKQSMIETRGGKRERRQSNNSTNERADKPNGS